jgi:hypothetical protein
MTYKYDSELAAYRDDSLTWLSNARGFGGSFIKAFADAVARADMHNLRILRPALQELRAKYPEYEKERIKAWGASNRHMPSARSWPA